MQDYQITVAINVQADDEDHALEQALDQIQDGQFTPEVNAMQESRLFWVVEGLSQFETENQNEEIFVTKDEALKYAEVFGKQAPYHIYIGEIRNFFQEADGSWNYDDQADTFTRIMTVVMQNDTRDRSREVLERGLTLNSATRTYYDESGNEYRDEQGQAIYASEVTA